MIASCTFKILTFEDFEEAINKMGFSCFFFDESNRFILEKVERVEGGARVSEVTELPIRTGSSWNLTTIDQPPQDSLPQLINKLLLNFKFT